MTTITTPITRWFKEAVPTPMAKNFNVQLGVHVEEFGEMLDALACDSDSFEQLKLLVKLVALELKVGISQATVINPQELLDALCDQVVTATGVAHMQGFMFDLALVEVNDSNWSKFVDGKAVFDGNGKIAKGPNYFRPKLGKYI